MKNLRNHIEKAQANEKFQKFAKKDKPFKKGKKVKPIQKRLFDE